MEHGEQRNDQHKCQLSEFKRNFHFDLGIKRGYLGLIVLRAEIVVGEPPT